MSKPIKWSCNWYQKSLLAMTQSPQKLQNNFSDHMIWQKWPWYHKKNKIENGWEVKNKWKMLKYARLFIAIKGS